MLIALIRHADYHQRKDAPSAQQPYPLTDAGAIEAARQAQLLQHRASIEGWQIAPQLHCSNLLRAWQTAHIFAQQLNQSGDQEFVVAETPALIERSVGSLANLTVEEIEHVLTQDPRHQTPSSGWKSDAHYRLPVNGAESLKEAGLRVARFIESQVSRQHSHHLQLFFGHGAAFRQAACHLGVITEEHTIQLSMYHAHPVILKFNNEQWQHIAGEWKQRAAGSKLTD